MFFYLNKKINKNIAKVGVKGSNPFTRSKYALISSVYNISW
jgi:hypothetical protein